MRVILETPRLLLREMARQEDLDFVTEMLLDQQVMRYYNHTYTPEEAETWLLRQLSRYERDGHGLWLVQERGSGRKIGQVGLVMQEVDGSSEPEIGYLVHRPFWRRGYAAEAATGVRDYAFGGLGYDHVIALVRPENTPSQGVARALGMSPWKRTVRAGLDHIVFALRRDGAPM
jgi:[ribosomal protein S5]-alanine N-acetyltransferase